MEAKKRRGAYDFACRQLNYNEYEISWIVDFPYGSRKMTRFTDYFNAKVFCKKHNLPFERRLNDQGRRKRKDK